MRGVSRNRISSCSFFWVLLLLSSQLLFSQAPPTPFQQCPAIGGTNSCAVLIVINANSTISVYVDSNAGTFADGEDTLTGILNNSNKTITSLPLNSTTDIFAFDGDGICGITPLPAGCPFGSTGYEGPGVSFSNISSDGTSGTLNFSPGLAPSRSAYFALEEALTASQVTVPLNTNCPANTATVGVFYSSQSVGTGGNGTYTWSLAGGSLAPLTLSSSGLVSGTPAAASTLNFILQITDGTFASATQQCSIVVSSAQSAVTVIAGPVLTRNGIDTAHNTCVITAPPAATNFLSTDALITIWFGLGSLGAQDTVVARFSFNGQLLPSLDQPFSGFSPGSNYFFCPGLIPNGANAVGQWTVGVYLNNQSSPLTSVTFTVSLGGAGGTPLIQVAPTSLTFSAAAGGDAPPSQAISVLPGSGTGPLGTFRVVVDSGQQGTAAPSWLTVQPNSGTVPAQLLVNVNQGTQQPGTNLGRIGVLDFNGVATYVSVTLNVASAPAKLTVAPSLLRFSARAQAPGILQQNLAITSGGGGGSLGFSASILAGSSWIRGVTPGSGQTTPNSPVLLQVQVNTQGLQVGGYYDVVRVSSSAGNVDVPISLFVAASGPILGVNVTALRFPARQGGGQAAPQSIKVLNIGDPGSTVNWTADFETLVPGSDWLSLGNTSGTATTSAPGVLNLTSTAASAQLTAGSRYALIRISDPHSLNSPQYVVAVLDLQPGGAPALPDPFPAGLFFGAVAGGASTAGQAVAVRTTNTSPVAFQAAASTNDGRTWLKLSTGQGSSTSQNPGTVTVSTDPTGLTAGIYTGGVGISMSGVVRTVSVTFAVLPSGATITASTALQVPEATGCTPSKLALTQIRLANNFSVPAQWPTPLIVQLNDDCASLVTNGAVIASFSNGDAPLTLRSDGVGSYSATWQPGAVSSQMLVTVNASAGTLQPVTAKLIGGVTQNQAPVLTTGGTLNNLNPVVGGPLAPGTVAQVYGSNLASSSGSPNVLPLPPTSGGTFMLVGGYFAPFYYLSGGQLNVQLPNELAPNQQYAAVVSVNNALTMPDLIDFVPAQPGVAALADGHVIAQHNSTFAMVSGSNPAKPSEFIIVYLAGMGATNPSVATGAPSPLAPVTVAPTVTIDGQPATVAYAGLTPGAAGLYQITLQVPSNARSGDLNLVISQGGATANATKLIVSQ